MRRTLSLTGRREPRLRRTLSLNGNREPIVNRTRRRSMSPNPRRTSRRFLTPIRRRSLSPVRLPTLNLIRTLSLNGRDPLNSTRNPIIRQAIRSLSHESPVSQSRLTPATPSSASIASSASRTSSSSSSEGNQSNEPIGNFFNQPENEPVIETTLQSNYNNGSNNGSNNNSNSSTSSNNNFHRSYIPPRPQSAQSHLNTNISNNMVFPPPRPRLTDTELQNKISYLIDEFRRTGEILELPAEISSLNSYDIYQSLYRTIPRLSPREIQNKLVYLIRQYQETGTVYKPRGLHPQDLSVIRYLFFESLRQQFGEVGITDFENPPTFSGGSKRKTIKKKNKKN